MKAGAITSDLIARSGGMLELQCEHGTSGPFFEFNSGGVEIEVGELLYSLVRTIKPKRVLETGTHLGVSASYIATALRDNDECGKGDGKMSQLETFEIFKENRDHSMKLWANLGLSPDRIKSHLLSSFDFKPEHQYQFALLDSEPHIRFAEFDKYLPYFSDGAVIVIHDLHPHLSYHNKPRPGLAPDDHFWPFTDIRKSLLGEMIRTHQVMVISLPTPRGCTIFQKIGTEFTANAMAAGLHLGA